MLQLPKVGFFEPRRELWVSQRPLAQLSGVPRHTIRTLERGGRVDPALVIRLAGTLNVLELAAPPKDDPPGAMVFDLERELAAWAVDAAGVVRSMRGAA